TAERRLDRAREHLDGCHAGAGRDGDALGASAAGTPSPFAEAILLRGVLLVDATVLAGLPDDVLAAQAAALRGEVGHLEALAREAAELAPARARRGALVDAIDTARQALDDAVAGAAARGPALAAETDRLARAEAQATGLPTLEAALAAAEAVVAAVAERDRLAARAAADVPRLDVARELRSTAREHWLDCRERRLAQMAAELAEQLAAGDACPVCGSVAHPAPARPGPGRVTEAEEERARAAFEQADAAYSARAEAAARLAEQLAAATAGAAGLTTAEAAERSRAAREAVGAARHAAAGIAGRKDAIARLTAAIQHDDEAIEAARGRLHELQTELAARSAAVAELAGRCERSRGDDPGLAERASRLASAATRLDGVLAARRDHSDALRAAATARRTALAAARQAGFSDLGAALTAVVPDAERAELDRLVRAHDNELAAVTAQLRDPQLVAAAALPAPDLDHLRAVEVLALGDDEECARRVAAAEHAVAELREIETVLAGHLAGAEPLQARHRTLAELARCADGTGGDNARRMSLSAYVLAARLEEVARAASLRLTQMSGGRYTLEHSDSPARGQRRAGLGLHVVDAWTGHRRDTATLSGGESFYTSLALALGLADVVCAEAGGTAIETLFVDEGFGSLDDDTLEEVMDVLDGLRSGGRSVGLVSHLADLRYRIPAQIEVVKGRSGSHLAVAAG
ncbi:MAG TPA: SbcC/MukB-like Walker B domain-containing protein, partial [Kineosporiaceae bacterium]